MRLPIGIAQVFIGRTCLSLGRPHLTNAGWHGSLGRANRTVRALRLLTGIALAPIGRTRLVFGRLHRSLGRGRHSLGRPHLPNRGVPRPDGRGRCGLQETHPSEGRMRRTDAKAGSCMGRASPSTSETVFRRGCVTRPAARVQCTLADPHDCVSDPRLRHAGPRATATATATTTADLAPSSRRVSGVRATPKTRGVRSQAGDTLVNTRVSG